MRRGFLWLGELFLDYLDVLQCKNITFDVSASMIALLEACQNELFETPTGNS